MYFCSMSYHLEHLSDTICAPATAQGVSAISVIRVSGTEAISIVAGNFAPGHLENVASNSVVFGKIMDGNELIDEVLVSVYRNPKSFTGEDTVEISAHGSPYIQSRILGLLLKGGCRLAEPGEFTRRAFLNGKMDLTHAEAIADLISSNSSASHSLAIRQMKGGFAKEIEELRANLVRFAALLELELDFGEEDVEFAKRDELTQLTENTIQRLRKMEDSFALGNVLKQGVKTAITGRPNAGKSTLLNTLLNEERAIVSEVAGTTRDTIEEVLNINGILFRLIDTAGIRETEDVVEKMGIDRSLKHASEADILIYMYDISEMSDKEAEDEVAAINTGDAKVLFLANKADKKISKASRHLNISAKTPESAVAVRQALFQLSGADNWEQESVIVSNARHVQALRESRMALEIVQTGLKGGKTGDMLALDLREALHHMGLISGEVGNEELLDHIFRNFCIGK